jgi:hypothetical protein
VYEALSYQCMCLRNAKAEAEEAKIAELENLRKKHDMLSMSLEEDAKRKSKTLQVLSLLALLV